MTYAIIETGGKQLRVEVGRFYDVDRLAIDEEDTVTIDKVLFVEHDGEASFGQPLIAGATVEATVLSHLRGRKIIVYKMRPKKKTRKKQGHRQELTRLMIEAINLDGKTVAGESMGTSAPAADSAEPDDEDSPSTEKSSDSVVDVSAVETEEDTES